MKKYSSNNRILVICSAAVIFTVIAAAAYALSHSEKEPITETRFMLDTVCTVTLYSWSGDGNETINGVFQTCKFYEDKLSATVKGSDIYNINHSKGKPVEVSQETAELLKRALDYCELSNGEFDITIYPVKALWNFSGDGSSIPATEALSKAAALVDYTKLKIDGTTVTLPKGMGVDLGAIAKGFIADRAAEYLMSRNVTSALIDLGGNIYALGNKPDGNLWRVGIRKPFSDGEADIVEASDSSVVTSGVYQRCFEKDGKLYHHILRSSDGMPCDTGLYSVTVISKSSEQCDALSTVCMLLGYEKSTRLLKNFNDVRAVFIASEEQLLYY